MTAVVQLGDARSLTMPDESVDAVVCDPPYELGFMGKRWDASGIAYDLKTWQGVLRVLKPGGHLLAFGGTRTSHRMATAIEDAGFEMRDSIIWLYGSGFPKSLDVSKAIDKAAGAPREVVGEHHRHGGGSPDSGSMAGPLGTASVLPLTAPATDLARQFNGWGTALKPAHEPIVVARRPFRGTVADNVLAHGTGALNVDGCRAGTNGSRGRWPSNVVLSHLSDTDGGDACASGCVDGCPVAELDGQSGTLTRGNHSNASVAYADLAAGSELTGYGDTGGASRFFPTFRYQAKAPTKERPKVDGLLHPTVKPLALIRWLVRLVTPPGGTVLDPFAGSGTTAEAAILEGFDVIAIENHEPYLALIEERVLRAAVQGELS